MTQPIENQQVIKAIIYLQEIGKIPINAELSRILLEKVKYKASEQYISQVLKGKDPLSKKLKVAIMSLYEKEIIECSMNEVIKPENINSLALEITQLKKETAQLLRDKADLQADKEDLRRDKADLLARLEECQARTGKANVFTKS